MRPVDRNLLPGPASLLTPGRPGPAELARATTHYSPPPKDSKFNFRAYKGEDVRHALESLFHGKCAYCESRYDVSGPVDVEHFRPKGEVEDVPDHPGYWWLAAEWTNLLPSCLDCNRRRYQPTPKSFASISGILDAAHRSGFTPILTGKEACFPIAGSGSRMPGPPPSSQAAAAIAAEQGLLLDPCSDDPADHLRFHIDRDQPLGIVYPTGSAEIDLPLLPAAITEVQRIEQDARSAGVSVRGAVSIQVYGLNRLALIQERTRLLRKLEFLATIIIDLSDVADGVEALSVAATDEEVRSRAVERIRATVQRALAEIASLAAPRPRFRLWWGMDHRV